ncbi:large conductance mechanosensitive channel protein MscL [Bacillus sp. Cr_A10]|uniref:large conductance mechanosensitive channel protein MscL n=1 Tax=Bacillus sp. Cr_A10 TaxID=3033993 RepID=UPI0023DAB1F2|nr:large conductance mechanosensitive channel protein MscL [Bacillus sp. Cr_A10]MDF2066866.1 large conductance mechanosensitive channel protein MscL [Bacillus sp. Cr_A10]
MWQDFKKFAFKGNVLDLAIAVVIGGAFGKIVSSLVENIITPIIGLLLFNADFSTLKYKEILFGEFIKSVFDFFVIAFSIFLFVRLLSKFKRKEDVAEAVEEAPPVDAKEVLLEEIRDLLKKQNNV